MSKKGGYVIVDLKGQSITAGTPFTLDGVTARLNRAKNKACLLSGFAIGNEEKRDVFVDLQPTEDGYIAFFGQYTITIEDDEVTITNGGVLLDDIVDSYGRKRFIEGDGVNVTTISGFTTDFKKYSLSGTHLMIVIFGNVEAGTSVPANKGLVSFAIPKWIYDKIEVILGQNVEFSAIKYRAEDWSSVDQNVALVKESNKLIVSTVGANAVLVEKASKFRIVFDLLIDSAE